MKDIIPLIFYIVCIVLILLSIFKDRRIGIYYFLPLLPLIFLFVKIQQYPIGKDIVDLMLLAIITGWFMQERGLVKTNINLSLIIFMVFTFLALMYGYNYLGTGFEFGDYRMQKWKNYMIMPLLFFIVVNNIKNLNEIKKLVFYMSCVTLLIALVFFRGYSDRGFFDWSAKQDFSVFVYFSGNHLAAYMTHYIGIFLCLFYYCMDNMKYRMYYLINAFFGTYAILFSFSRGAYLAFSAIMFSLGILKDRRILTALFILLLFWHVILPASVFQRINMSLNAEDGMGGESDSRAVMWAHAIDLFNENPMLGTGYFTFKYTISEEQKSNFKKVIGRGITDTHSLYFNVLAEMGIIGVSLILYLFYLAARSGWRLFMLAEDGFLKGLGLGFFLSVLACMITNAFGDRWSSYELQSHYWMFWALTERGLILTKEKIRSMA